MQQNIDVMKRLQLILIPLFLSLNLFAQSSDKDLSGMWTNEDKSQKVEFVKTTSGYEATIKDAEEKAIIGKKIITGLQVQKDGTYGEGTIHFIKMNGKGKCTAKLLNEKLLEIKGSKGIMSRTQKWTKVK